MGRRLGCSQCSARRRCAPEGIQSPVPVFHGQRGVSVCGGLHIHARRHVWHVWNPHTAPCGWKAEGGAHEGKSAWPQPSFIIGGSCLKYHFCCNKKRVLSRQTCVCGDKNMSFVATKVCLLQQNFCPNKKIGATKNWMRQAYFCHDKHVFVATKHLSLQQRYACHDKTFVVTNKCLLRQIFVEAKVLLQQKYFVLTNNFVVASILLSWQKTCFVGTNMSHKNDTCLGPVALLCSRSPLSIVPVATCVQECRACCPALLEVPFKHCFHGSMCSGV